MSTKLIHGTAPPDLDLSRVADYRYTETPLGKRRYGSMIPSSLMLQLDGKRWYRVYVLYWINCSAAYVVTGGQRHYLPLPFAPAQVCR